jgi:hypothetical protein
MERQSEIIELLQAILYYVLSLRVERGIATADDLRLLAELEKPKAQAA